MKFLIVSQVYWPDSTAVSQILTDLAEDLVRRGHQVSVIASSRDYEQPKRTFPGREVHGGVRIERIDLTAFGKRHIIGRVIDAVSFNVRLFFKLLAVPKGDYDVLIGLTVPPLVSFVSVRIARWKDMKFAYWAMDLQPELSIATGYVKKDSLVARLATWMGESIYRRADLVIVLDRFMSEHILKRGASRTAVIPVWPVSGPAHDGTRLENPFRASHGLGDKLIVMYSGNHSAYNPLDTLLQAALLLQADPRFLFLFVGGGVRKKDVTAFREAHQLDNIRELPLQERANLVYSLAAADVQVVVLGDACRGLTHPSKVYGALFIGRPLLYIGPRPSHVTDLLEQCPGNLQVGHGDAEQLAADLRTFAGLGETVWARIGAGNRAYAEAHLTRERIAGRLMDTLEELGRR
jgi:colanic acid biosynthesis glycosyl transferase WcaI